MCFDSAYYTYPNPHSNPTILQGREALAEKQKHGLQRKLICLTSEAKDTHNILTGAHNKAQWKKPLNGKETIWRDGKCVGIVRSTAYGHWIEKVIQHSTCGIVLRWVVSTDNRLWIHRFGIVRGRCS